MFLHVQLFLVKLESFVQGYLFHYNNYTLCIENYSNGMKTVVGQSVKPMVNLRQPVQQSNPTYSSLVKEFDDISEKYKDRIIPGSTVNEFNSIINQLSVCIFL